MLALGLLHGGRWSVSPAFTVRTRRRGLGAGKRHSHMLATRCQAPSHCSQLSVCMASAAAWAEGSASLMHARGVRSPSLLLPAKLLCCHPEATDVDPVAAAADPPMLVLKPAMWCCWAASYLLQLLPGCCAAAAYAGGGALLAPVVSIYDVSGCK